MSEFKLSIIIPTFNRPTLLRRALVSVFQDTLGRFELIVVNDDRNKERSRIIYDEFRYDTRIRLVDNIDTPGPSGARNFGAKLAKGEFLLFLDDDDQFHSGYIDSLIEHLCKTPNMKWGFSKVFLAKNDQQLKSIRKYVGDGHFIPETGRPNRRHLAGLGYGFWIQRNLFLEAGMIEESLTTNEDTEFCLRLLTSNILPHIFSHCGVRIDSTTRSRPLEQSSITRSSSTRNRWENFRYILDRHQNFLEANPDLGNYILKRYLKLLAKGRQNLRDQTKDLQIRNPLLIMYFYLNRLVYGWRGAGQFQNSNLKPPKHTP